MTLDVSDGPAYSGLVSWSERRMDLCLKRPSFYCLIHFYKRLVIGSKLHKMASKQPGQTAATEENVGEEGGSGDVQTVRGQVFIVGKVNGTFHMRTQIL